MSALLYLYRSRIKNKIKSVLKSPGQIIIFLFLIAMVVLNLFARRLDGDPIPTRFRNISELYAVIAALYSVMFILICYNGVSRGGSLFTMADVNYIFVSTIPPVKTIFYGLVQQLGTSVLVGFFIIFQYTLLNSTYGVSFPFLLLILLGYAIVILCGQLTSIVIYSYTSGSDKNRKKAKTAILAASALLVGYILIRGLAGNTAGLTGDRDALLAGLVRAANGTLVSLLPVAGWLKDALVGIWSGNFLLVLAGLAGTIVYVGVIVYLLTKSGDDFYEDVLQTTERTFQTLTASKSGGVAEAVPQNVKVGKTGLQSGFGANTLYYKHKLENRRARVFFFDISTIIALVSCIVFAFIFKSQGVLLYFGMTTYIMMLTVALGRWIKELIKPYIYLIPEPPFIKLVHCLRGTLVRQVIEAVLLFAVATPILGLSAMHFVFLVVARISFGLLFLSANIFIERFFSFITIKLVAVLIFFMSMVVFAIPGVIVAAILAALQLTFLPVELLVFGSMAICNLMIALLAVYISRNMLEFAELNSR